MKVNLLVFIQIMATKKFLLQIIFFLAKNISGKLVLKDLCCKVRESDKERFFHRLHNFINRLQLVIIERKTTTYNKNRISHAFTKRAPDEIDVCQEPFSCLCKRCRLFLCSFFFAFLLLAYKFSIAVSSEDVVPRENLAHVRDTYTVGVVVGEHLGEESDDLVL